MYTTIQNRKLSRVIPTRTKAPLQLVSLSNGTLDGHETMVDWRTDTIGGSTVGVYMKAIVGPEHQQGGPPKLSALKELMGKLVTNPNNSNDKKYIKGHLLNDNVGGPGEAYNLFPITAAANKEHERSIESPVKEWVNQGKHWVNYEVKVEEVDKSLDNYFIEDNYVDCKFVCEASLLAQNLNNELVETGNNVSSTIPSIHKRPSSAETIKNKAIFFDNMSEQRSDYKPSLSKAKGTDPWIDTTIMEELEAAYRVDPVSTKRILILQNGIGEATFAALEIIFKDHSYDYSCFSSPLKSAYTKLRNAGPKRVMEKLKEELKGGKSVVASKRKKSSFSTKEKKPKKPR